LGRAADEPLLIVERRLRKPAAVAAEQGARLQADPFAQRATDEVDRQIAVDEHIFVEVQGRTDAIAGIRRDRRPLIGARRLVPDQRMLQAKPDGRGPSKGLSLCDAVLDEVLVAEFLFVESHRDHRAFGDRPRRKRRRVAGRISRNGQVVLPLHQRGEAGDVLALRNQAAGEVAGVAAKRVFANLDSAFADRRGPQQIDRESAEVRKASF
jgi:hypothetical protein